MALLDKNITKVWDRYFEQKLNRSRALIKLWELREDPIEDRSLFLVPLHNLPDAEIGERFSANGYEFEVAHIEYDYLFVRQL